jgi:Zn-dependent protease with chaperone function
MIHEVAIFAANCLGSVAIFSSLCAIVIVPFLGWLAVRLLTARIRRLNSDAAWQAPLAAAAALVPGALLVGLLIVTVLRGGAPCLDYVAGRWIAGAVGFWILIALGRATWLALSRFREARSLIGRARPACGRVAQIATSYGLHARVIHHDEPFCALTGLFRPVVLLSSATPELLSYAELRAAIRHEAAHARRGDLVIGAVVSFFADLLPFSIRALQDIYHSAREFAADRDAARAEGAEALASALITLARGTLELRATVAMASGSTVRSRLRALLQSPQPSDAHLPWRRAAVITALTFLVIAGLAPAGATLLHESPCLTGAMVEH